MSDSDDDVRYNLNYHHSNLKKSAGMLDLTCHEDADQPSPLTALVNTASVPHQALDPPDSNAGVAFIVSSAVRDVISESFATNFGALNKNLLGLTELLMQTFSQASAPYGVGPQPSSRYRERQTQVPKHKQQILNKTLNRFQQGA